MLSSLSNRFAISSSQETPIFYRLACCMMVLHAFFLPLSTTVTNVFFFGFIAIWFLENNAKAQWAFYFSYPLTKPILGLVALTLIGVFYSSGEGESILRSTSQMLRLSTIPILAYYLQEKNPYRKWILPAFVAALILTILATLLKVYGGFSIGHKTYENNIFKNHIVISYFMAMALFICAIWLKKYHEHKIILCILLGLIAYYFIFLNTGRTGYLILYVCFAVFAWYQYRVKGVMIAFLGLSCMMVFAYHFSEPFLMRMENCYTELQLYLQGEGISPMGSRLDFIINSLKLWLQNPIWGSGTGSFMVAYQGAYFNQITVLTDNPHNQYLNNLIEWGIVGLFALLWLFYRQWKVIQKLSGSQLVLAQGIFLSFFIGCFFNSWIKNFTECHFYCLMTAYFFSVRVQRQ